MAKKRRRRGQYATAAFDGYRVRLYEEDPSSLVLDVQLRQDDKVVDGLCLFAKFGASFDEIAQLTPGLERQKKAAAAMVRFLNEGGDLDELRELFAKVTQWCENVQSAPVFPLAATGSAERHERTFSLPNGNYLYIVENISAEELTVEQLKAYYESADSG